MAAIRIITAVCVGLLAGTYGEQSADGAEPEDAIRIDAPTSWRGEHIDLPPGFAPGMKLQGVEETRFAPGMFDAAARDFLSYVIVFRLDGGALYNQGTLRPPPESAASASVTKE